MAMIPSPKGHVAEGRRWTGRSWPGEALRNLLAEIPRPVYVQTLSLSSASSLRGGDLLCGKYPAGRAPETGRR